MKTLIVEKSLHELSYGESFLALMHELIISTHSPILLSYPSSRIYEIREQGLVEMDYEETETFKISRKFLNDYKGMLEELLS